MGNTGAITNNILDLFVVILIAGIVSKKLSEVIKIPDVVLFLFAGIIIGPAGFNCINISGDPVAIQVVLTFGAAFILYDGGREIKLNILNDVKVTVGLLATIGVFITAVMIGFAAMYIFHMNFIYGILLGAVIASTDPAALIPVFKNIKIKDKVKQTVISESAFNDAVGAILIFSILTIIQSGKFSLAGNIYELVKMIVGGTLVGILTGAFFSVAISDSKYGILHDLAPIISILAVGMAFLGAERVGGSGYMATFVLGLTCGNKRKFKFNVPEQDFVTQNNVKDTLAFLMRIAIFILLGIQVNFEALSKYWLGALLVAIILICVVRPLVVLICTTIDKKANWGIREKLFIMWVRETGVIPAALSSMIVAMKLPHSDIIASVVFMTILVTLVVQASTTEAVAKKLGLLQDDCKIKSCTAKAC